LTFIGSEFKILFSQFTNPPNLFFFLVTFVEKKKFESRKAT